MNTSLYFHRFVTKLAILFASLFTFSGCIMEDLPECPPDPETGKIWLNLSFTLHEQEDGAGHYTNADRFAEFARSVEVFIFDADGRFVKKQTDSTGPFDPETGCYRMPVELLPGSYRAITYVNLSAEDAVCLLPEPVAGVTTIDQLRVQLSCLSRGNSTGQLQPLFYGDTEPFTIEKAVGYDQEINIPSGLVRNTNRIHFAIAWRDKKTQKLCPYWTHADSTRIYIEDINGSLDLDNHIAEGGDITYIPTYLTGKAAPVQSLSLSADDGDGGAAVLHAEADMLRLLTSSAPRLRVCRLQRDGTEKQVYEADLMKDFIARLYKTQEALDRRDLFSIDMVFECEHTDPNESWIAIKLAIDGWVLVDNGDMDL